MYRTIIFDLDNTLVEQDTPTLLPNRKEVITGLNSKGIEIYLASNQSPPSWNRILSKNKPLAAKYYTLADMIARFERVMNELPIISCHAALIVGDATEADKLRKMLRNPDKIIDLSPTKIIMSYRLDWRKPLPGMLNFIVSNYRLDRRECLFVGDNDRDKQVARNARMDFQHADDFFDQRSVSVSTPLTSAKT